MPYDCPNCGKPIPTSDDWKDMPTETQRYYQGLNAVHQCDSRVTAETIRRIVREEIRAALGKSE